MRENTEKINTGLLQIFIFCRAELLDHLLPGNVGLVLVQ